RLTTPLFPEGTASQRTVPVINDIRTRVTFSKADLLPDAAFTDGVSLDPTKDYYPFGPQPARYTTFYLASRETFQRKGALVSCTLNLSQEGPPQGSLKLEWEFDDGKRWSPLGIQASARADSFTGDGTITFLCPPSWAETSVNGTNNFWLRVRL